MAAIEEQFSRLDAGAAALESVRQNLRRMRALALNSLLHGSDGMMPQVEMGDVLTRGRYGASTKCCKLDGAGLPVLRIPNVQAGSISFQDMKFRRTHR